MQYSRFNKNLNTVVRNNFNNTFFELSQNRNQEFDVSVISGRTDLEKTFKNEMKLEIGGLILSANAKTYFNVFNMNTNATNFSNYNFKEQNISGYSQLSGKIKAVDYSIGFRVENTNVLGKFETEINPLVKKNYTNFFPKMQFDIVIDSSKTIALNYSKGIVRPNYSATNQGATYINPYFIYGTNINLNPTINDEFAANFQYNDKSVRLSYYNNSSPVYGDFNFDDTQKILTFSQKNFDNETGFRLEITMPFKCKIWTANNNLSIYLNKIRDETVIQMSSKPYLYYYSNNSFSLPKDYTFLINIWGLTTQKEGVFERMQPNFMLDLAISKTFFKNWDCTLSFNDVFKTMVYKENFTINRISSKSNYLSDAHEISFGIKYFFGKIKNSEFKEKNINENESRIR